MNYPAWFKNWVWSLPFVRGELLRQASIDAFKKAREDLEETNEYNTEERAKELMEQRLSDLLSIVDPKYIVTLNEKRGLVYIGGEQADEARLMNLKQEAEAIEQFELWKILHQTPKQLAQRAMFISGDSIDDMKKGRSMLFTLDTQQRILDTFKGYTQHNK